MIVALLVLIFLAIIFPGFFRFVIGGFAFLVLAALIFAPAHAEPTEGEKKGMVMPNVIALSDCIAFQVVQLANGEISPSTLGPLLTTAISKCEPFKRQMISYYDTVFAPGQGQAFFDGPYRKDLSRAVMQRIRSGNVKQPQLSPEVVQPEQPTTIEESAASFPGNDEIRYRTCIVNTAINIALNGNKDIDEAIEAGLKNCRYSGQYKRMGGKFYDGIRDDVERKVNASDPSQNPALNRTPTKSVQPVEYQEGPNADVSAIFECHGPDHTGCADDQRFHKVWLKMEDDEGRWFFLDMEGLEKSETIAKSYVAIGQPGQPPYLWNLFNITSECNGHLHFFSQKTGFFDQWVPPKSVWAAVSNVMCSDNTNGKIVTVAHWPWETDVIR